MPYFILIPEAFVVLAIVIVVAGALLYHRYLDRVEGWSPQSVRRSWEGTHRLGSVETPYRLSTWS